MATKWPQNKEELPESISALIDKYLTLTFSQSHKDERGGLMYMISSEANNAQLQSEVYADLMTRTQVYSTDSFQRKNVWKLLRDIATRLKCPDVALLVLTSFYLPQQSFCVRN